jgi:hypothetical protein
MPNLILDSWKQVDPSELRILLNEFVGGPGQHETDETNKIYLPLGRDKCFVSLTFKGNRIRCIEPGRAFDQARWNDITDNINGLLFRGQQQIVRWWTFNTYRVVGFWHGAKSGIQILPPLPDTPNVPIETADHAFILELPFLRSGCTSLDQYRMTREHRKLTTLLNLLLRGKTSRLLNSSDQHWALVTSDIRSPGYETKWVQRGFFAKLGRYILDTPSPPEEVRIDQVDTAAYYSEIGHDGRPMRVPADLDDAICTYRSLGERQERFDRATYWFDMADQLWPFSYSASFASLVSAIESLTIRGDQHRIHCPKCGIETSHPNPGPTKLFRDFLEKYAPEASSDGARKKMYNLRSDILHGSGLMQMDQQRGFGWDPPGWNEQEIHQELWRVTRIALRNWLLTPMDTPVLPAVDVGG